MSLLLVCEILALFVNILTANHKDSLCSKEKLQQSIQMQLCKKPKALSEIFVSYLKSRSTFEHFQKIDDPQSLCISEITDCERRD